MLGLKEALGAFAAFVLPGNLLKEVRQSNIASYRTNLDLVLDLGKTPVAHQGSVKKAVQVHDCVSLRRGRKSYAWIKSQSPDDYSGP
jgi:hypothetical protein